MRSDASTDHPTGNDFLGETEVANFGNELLTTHKHVLEFHVTVDETLDTTVHDMNILLAAQRRATIG